LFLKGDGDNALMAFGFLDYGMECHTEQEYIALAENSKNIYTNRRL